MLEGRSLFKSMICKTRLWFAASLLDRSAVRTGIQAVEDLCVKSGAAWWGSSLTVLMRVILVAEMELGLFGEGPRAEWNSSTGTYGPDVIRARGSSFLNTQPMPKKAFLTDSSGCLGIFPVCPGLGQTITRPSELSCLLTILCNVNRQFWKRQMHKSCVHP